MSDFEIIREFPTLFELTDLCKAVAAVNDPEFTREVTHALQLLQRPPVILKKEGA